ncbi:MAG: ATP phosphoribosyltransferase regulatory subunit [Betaproteobacteria bacterium]|nr:ATP phosphoribosyltransferase regulatory subunit [Betaproteobacteria bacterium]
MRKWLLPEHVDDILPPEAERIEALRSRLLELFRAHGYLLVMPPMLEYIESLLTGTGRDLDLRTFKLIDQFSGRTMGLRADITPQVARIDAHLLNRHGVARLCYCGTVLHSRPRDLTATREPLQIGAELYGHAGIEGDIEMLRLVRRALAAAGLARSRIDLGHVGVFRALARRAGIQGEQEEDLLEVLQQKDRAGILVLTTDFAASTRDALLELPNLYGDIEVLAAARKCLPADPDITSALDALGALVADHPDSVSIDLADLRGYHYHSGVVFAAYSAEEPGTIALGGRYDEVGEAFGRARPATGFSIDLRKLYRVSAQPPKRGGVLAPLDVDVALEAKITQLRTAGEIVIYELPGHAATLAELGCDRRIVRQGAAWVVTTLQ